MTVAAAGWVSRELIISVCHLWRGWSCDTGNYYTASFFWCGQREIYVWRIYLRCFAYNGESFTHSVVQLSLCSARGVLVNKFAWLHFLSCISSVQKKWHRTSVRCHCGATLMVWGVGISAHAGGGGREREMASREMEENERRQEERWRDDHVGHFIAVRKGLIYPPPLFAARPEGKLELCSKTASPLSGQEQKWLWKLLPQTEVSYCWPGVCAITQRGGPCLSWLQQLGTALINTLLFTH